jgi:hypothetical protein
LTSALLRGCLFFMLSLTALGQRTDHSIGVYGSFNDDARIFLFPQSPDPVLRQQTKGLGGSFGLAASWRYRVLPTVAAEFRGEFITREEAEEYGGTSVSHGFTVMLFEVSALFSLPFSGDRFDMYVGGGLGAYSGKRIYAIADAEAEHVSASPALGIHVLLGAEYLLMDRVGVRFILLFRDPQIGVENRFTRPSVTAANVTHPLQTDVFRSNINLNGNVYCLGLAYYF